MRVSSTNFLPDSYNCFTTTASYLGGWGTASMYTSSYSTSITSYTGSSLTFVLEPSTNIQPYDNGYTTYVIRD
jgi:hypothetical protein